jgi:hypothetical protein
MKHCYSPILENKPLLHIWDFIVIIMIIIIITAIEFLLGGSSPYTNTDETNKNKIKKKHTKHSQYKYTYYQTIHKLQNTHIHTPTDYKQVTTTTVQNIHQMKYSRYNQVPSV